MKKEKKTEVPDTSAQWLRRISGQLERLIVCMEHRVAGSMIPNFKSKDFVNKQ